MRPKVPPHVQLLFRVSVCSLGICKLCLKNFLNVAFSGSQRTGINHGILCLLSPAVVCGVHSKNNCLMGQASRSSVDLPQPLRKLGARSYSGGLFEHCSAVLFQTPPLDPPPQRQRNRMSFGKILTAVWCGRYWGGGEGNCRPKKDQTKDRPLKIQKFPKFPSRLNASAARMNLHQIRRSHKSPPAKVRFILVQTNKPTRSKTMRTESQIR